jgi:hypothetical protein
MELRNPSRQDRDQQKANEEINLLDMHIKRDILPKPGHLII